MTLDEHGTGHTEKPTARGTNGLGLAGFIVSLVGLCSGGALSPIGLILSFVALFRVPRGFAIAGFVIGLAGTLWMVFLFAVIGVAVVGGVVAGLIAGRGHFETTIEGWLIRDAVVAVYQETGAWPTGPDELTRLDGHILLDRWDRPYRIEIDPEAGALLVMSDGPDGTPDTDDDISVSFRINE